MIIRRPRSKSTTLPLPIHGIERVHETVILGVTISDRVGFKTHIDKICCKARQSMFALRILVSHGLQGQRLYDVVRATTLARLLYASPVWWGFANAGERNRLKSVLRKLIRLGFLPDDTPCFEEYCSRADCSLSLSPIKPLPHPS